MSTETAIFQALFAFIIAIIIVSLLLGIVSYIFQAIGLYSISKRRRLGTSGFAWVPILNLFKFGQVADDAVLNKSGKKPHFRIFYPILLIVGGIVCGVGSFVTSISFSYETLNLEAIMNSPEAFIDYVPEVTSETSLIIGGILFFLGILIIIVAEVLQYICLYHIYKSCSRKYIAMFILSFVFSILIPFFIFAIRKNDNPVYYVLGGQQLPPETYAPSDEDSNNYYEG